MTTPNSSGGEVVLYIGIKNGGERPLALLLEPWAEEFHMPPGVKYVVEGRGPTASAGFWVEHAENEITITAWPGSVVRILEDDQEVGGSVRRPPALDLT